MAKQIGIWLDYKEAYLISLDGEEALVQHLNSEVEDYHLRGGSRSRTPWGPMEKTSERRLLERRRQQLQRYFHKLMDAAGEADELFLFGPAEAKKGLEKAIAGASNFKPRLKGIETADAMTHNQMAARVRHFFSQN